MTWKILSAEGKETIAGDCQERALGEREGKYNRGFS